MGTTTAAEALADLLEAYGTTHVFFVPTILNNTLYQMERRTGIHRVIAHSEKAAAYMADGYARASGRPGICLAQTVGAANLASGLRDGFLASSPVVAVTGGPYRHSRGRFQYQEAEDRPMFAPVTKWSTRVDDAGRLLDTFRQAFQVATSGRPGPVHLELEGHQGESVELVEVAGTPAAEPRFGALAPFRTPPAADDVEAAAALLAGAERPAIVAGGGVRYAGARADLVALAEANAIPVAASLSGKDAIPAGHPLAVGVVGLYSRESANRVLAEADVVLFVGTKAGSQVTHSWRLPRPGAAVIHLDISPEGAGFNHPGAVRVVGDAAVSLRLLAERLAATGKHADRGPWLERVAALGREWLEANEPAMTAATVPMRPERLCRALSDTLPDDAVVVADTGHSGVWAAGWLDLRAAGQAFLRAAGSLGWAFPAALGAQCALPDRPVVAFTGDGGFWYHLAELETAARWSIPATVVVNNNSAFNQEIGIWTEAYGGSLHGRHHELWQFRQVDFSQVAAGIGVESRRVEDPADLDEALRWGIATKAPTLVEVVTDRNATAPKAYLPPAGG